ncbi:beta-lactamase family protein [bacterium]|nr:beta-lactamase family protein [bacterium]
MKKIITAMILLSMLFFGASCGSSSKNEEKQPDTDETSEDQDTEESEEEEDEESETDDFKPADDGEEEELKAVTAEEKLESIKNLAEEYVNFAHGTGVVVGYGKDELTSFAYGVRNSNTKEELQADDLFEVGSITKNFTAVTMLLLQEEGKIDLDQTIDTWFPDFEKGDIITVRMLLNHTSGIKEMTEILDPEDIVENVNGRFNFEPGTSWTYINANYVLAGLIMSEVAGKPAHEVIREKIIEPLGLTHTFMKDFEEHSGDEARAHGHTYDAYGNILPYEYPHKAWTAGSLVSNVEDLFKYGKALFNGKILSEDSMNQMLDIVELLGEPVYGLGTQYGIGSHSEFYGHGGDVFASHSMLYYYPETGEIHIILNNFNESKDMYVLNDEIEYVLMDDNGAKKKTDFPDWDKLIDNDKHTQIFALYSIMEDYPVYNLDYGIGYFAYPDDEYSSYDKYTNYYCQQYMFRYTDVRNDKVVKIASECIEPKEYYVGPFRVQRTDIDMYLYDFQSAVKTGKPTHEFYVTKYDYFYDLENEFVYKYCYYLEDSDPEKYMVISKDTNPSKTEFYHLWGKAKMDESKKYVGCYCYNKAGKERECTENDEYPQKEETDNDDESDNDEITENDSDLTNPDEEITDEDSDTPETDEETTENDSDPINPDDETTDEDSDTTEPDEEFSDEDCCAG